MMFYLGLQNTHEILYVALVNDISRRSLIVVFFFFCTITVLYSTVIKCLDQLFTLRGTPSYIKSDRGTSFLSQDIKHYLTQKGIATSKTTPYHPIGNGQCERDNGIIWKAVQLALKSHDLHISNGEMVLPSVLH